MRLASQRYGTGEDETQWAITGLLHDADYNRWPADHPRLVVAWLREAGEPAIAQAVVAHFNPAEIPELTMLDKGLLACDELAGFVMACCMVRPDGHPLDRTFERQEKAQGQEFRRQSQP